MTFIMLYHNTSRTYGTKIEYAFHQTLFPRAIKRLGTRLLGLMVMACRLLNSIGDQHYWTIAIILAICDTFTVVVVSQA